MTEAARLMFERPLRTQYGRWHEYLFEWRGEDVIVMAFGTWKNRRSRSCGFTPTASLPNS